MMQAQCKEQRRNGKEQWQVGQEVQTRSPRPWTEITGCQETDGGRSQGKT